MNELRAILSSARQAWSAGETPVLATVVATRGSSYRKRGARMLVTSEGWKAGSVSGGCLEADVVRKAAWLVEQGAPIVRTYDTSVDGEVALGCGGEIDVLLEPFRADSELAQAMARVVDERVEVALTRTLPGGHEWQETLRPSRRLVVCGAGHDALPVCSMALTLGWDVHVVDWRPAQASAARFPGATTHVLAPDALAASSAALPNEGARRVVGTGGPPLAASSAAGVELADAGARGVVGTGGPLLAASSAGVAVADGGAPRASGLPLERGCAVVVMSHHLVYDARVLEAVLRSPLPAYVGVLGPRKRTADLFAMMPKELPRERVHAPVGLALGGEGPSSVALAILAEVHAVLHGAPAAPMSALGKTP